MGELVHGHGMPQGVVTHEWGFLSGHVEADAYYHKSKILMEHPVCEMLGEILQTSESQYLCETSLLRYLQSTAQWSTYWAHQHSLGSRSNLRVRQGGFSNSSIV